MNNNRLFCSFTEKDKLDERLYEINSTYKILFGKIFVLTSPESDNEFMCTYNIDVDGTDAKVLSNTILLHRRKEHNVLYSINALNIIIKSANLGVMNTRYEVDWSEYKNSILLTKGTGLRILHTVIHKIVRTDS